MSQNLDFQALAKIPFAAATSLTGALTKQVAAFVTEAQGYSLAAFQSNLALIQKLASVKNVDELVNVQTEHARTSYEASIAWSKKVGELAADLSSQAVKTVLVSPQSASVSVKVPSVGKRLQATE
ncbi:phasin family protein [Rhodoblastus sp.]|uniref:phasin family protein n=1 Tax=Rhodoblastus sp. TaxID=1962975 RepID=UPI003F9935B9